MSLLREIQEAAIDSKVELSTLLRKCKVLAARLGNAEFKRWVENELSGYENKEELPPYRILTVNSKGHFSGPFGSGLRNADIPLFCIPEEFRAGLEHSYLMEPVASMEALVAKSEGGLAQEPWNPNLVMYVGQKIYQHMNCVQAWKVIPITSIVAALDGIRNRVLNFVLEIEAEAPGAGDAPINSSPVPQERVQQIFNTYITGTVQNMATGSTSVQQRAKYSEHQTDELLLKLLEAISAAPADRVVVAELASAVEGMRSSRGRVGFKQHYEKFMSTIADHIQVFGPIVAPFLPALAVMLP